MVSSVRTERGILVLRVQGTFDLLRAAIRYDLFTCVVPELFALFTSRFRGEMSLRQ